MIDQNKVFCDGEGNAWWHRNRDYLNSAEAIERDWPLKLLERNDLKPKRVLEVGCANGWRLKEVVRRYGARCAGFDASAVAVAEGKGTPDKEPGVHLWVGDAVDGSNYHAGYQGYDLVIVNFVLHWVDRGSLLGVVRNVDDALGMGGHLIIGDFWPGVWPHAFLKRRYHHRQDVEVWTYKADYAALFRATGMYRGIDQQIIDYATGEAIGAWENTWTNEAAMACCSLLVKEEQYKCE